MKNKFTNAAERTTINVKPGLTRTTLSFVDSLMICRFHEDEGTILELHTHEAVQNGYVLKGRIKFFLEDGTEFIAESGCAYVFESMEPHGSVALEETMLIESFFPSRPEYRDGN